MANGLTAIQIGNDVFPIDFSQHNHDDRYYTKDEITVMCMGLEDTGEEIDDVDVILQAQITQYVTNVITTSVVDEINSDK